MNCQEVQALVEEAIDDRLPEPCKRKVARHLACCESCKAFFAAEKSEHAALFRALNDVSDIPPPPVGPKTLAARLVKSVPALAKKAGRLAVPLWLKRVAVLAILCGGAAFAAWIGTTVAGSRLDDDGLAGRSPSDGNLSSTPKGEQQVKRTMLAASSAIAILAVPPIQGASSVEAAFDSFSSECSTTAGAAAGAFLSRYRTTGETDPLPSFSSFEPKGLYLFFK